MSTVQPSKTKDEVVRDFRTSGILDAANEVIAEQGWKDVSMERIAQVAGLSKGTLYLYFKNKESLLQRVFEHALVELETSTTQATQETTVFESRVRAIVATAMEHATKNHALIEILRADPTLIHLAPVQRDLDRYLNSVSKTIAQGTRGTAFRRINARRSARHLLALVRGSLSDGLRESRSQQRQEIDDVVHFFFHGISAGDNS